MMRTDSGSRTAPDCRGTDFFSSVRRPNMTPYHRFSLPFALPQQQQRSSFSRPMMKRQKLISISDFLSQRSASQSDPLIGYAHLRLRGIFGGLYYLEGEMTLTDGTIVDLTGLFTSNTRPAAA